MADQCLKLKSFKCTEEAKKIVALGNLFSIGVEETI